MADPDRLIFCHPAHARQAYEVAITFHDVGVGVEVRLNSRAPLGGIYVMDHPPTGEPYSFATLPLGLASTRELATEMLARLVPHLEHPELPVREMVQATYGSLAELRVMGDPRILDSKPIDSRAESDG